MHEGQSATLTNESRHKEEDQINFTLAAPMESVMLTLDEALRGPNAKQWQVALDYEIRQLEKLGTWVIEDLPKGQTTILCSEVLKEKRRPDRNIETYKVRIVVGGHCQIEGINYTKTFAAAAKLPSVQVVMGNVAIHNWEIHHINVKSAYINAPLKDLVYIKIPRGARKESNVGSCLLLTTTTSQLSHAQDTPKKLPKQISHCCTHPASSEVQQIRPET